MKNLRQSGKKTIGNVQVHFSNIFTISFVYLFQDVYFSTVVQNESNSNSDCNGRQKMVTTQRNFKYQVWKNKKQQHVNNCTFYTRDIS